VVAADAGLMQIQLWNKEGRKAWRSCVVEHDPVACTLGNWRQGGSSSTVVVDEGVREDLFRSAKLPVSGLTRHVELR
jgi:hypothetical protein